MHKGYITLRELYYTLAYVSFKFSRDVILNYELIISVFARAGGLLRYARKVAKNLVKLDSE